ncbi:MAG: type II secretion system protein N [Gammaproteobacteria bacterium]
MIAKTIIAILVLLASYVGFLAANAPAAWVIAQAQPQLEAAKATLSDVRGSAWNGSAELGLRDEDLGRLHWQASFWPLITGHLNADVSVQGSELKLSGHIAGAGQTLQLSHVKGEAALPVLARLAGLPGGLSGTLTADLDKVAFKQQALQSAQGNLVAHGVGVPDLGVSLGTLTLNLYDSGSGVQGKLANSGGDLELAGTLSLITSGIYVLRATLKPRGNSAKSNQIRDALAAVLGAPDSSGHYHYNATGHLNLGAR